MRIKFTPHGYSYSRTKILQVPNGLSLPLDVQLVKQSVNGKMQ